MSRRLCTVSAHLSGLALSFALALSCTLALGATLPAFASDRGLDLPPVERIALEGGGTLLLVPKRDVPLVSVQVMVRGGTRLDPEGQEGVGSLAVELLRKGAGTRSADTLAEELDGRGASLSLSADLTAFSLSVDALAVDTEWCVSLLGDLVARPSFPEGEVLKLRDRTIDEIKSAREQPQAVIGQYFRSALFAGHPFGRPGSGTETTLATLDAAKVSSHWQRVATRDRLVVAVGGDFDRDLVVAAVRKAFEDALPVAGDPLPPLVEQPHATGRRVLLVDMPDASQTYFWIGGVGIPRSYPDDAVFDLVRTAFGGRFTSMLNTALRIESGLTYGARLSVQQLEVSGALAITSFTETSKTKEALDLALATLDRLHTEKLKPAAVASARTYLRGQLPPTLETGHAVTQTVLDLERFGLPATTLTEYFTTIDKVTAADTTRVIDQVFPKTGDVLMVLVGKASAIRELAQTYGPVTETKLADPSF